MKIKAVLFDCDGLMFDTENLSQNMWRKSARRHGSSIPDEFFVLITGRRSTEEERKPYYEKIPHLEEIMGEMRAWRFDPEYWDHIERDSLNKPGLLELFPWLKENGYRTAICSSSNRSYVESLAENVSVPLEYDAIVTGDMVKETKPNPEIFLKGAELLGVLPEECLVLEDSKNGILAAVNAGMHNCFIQDTIVPDEEMKRAIEYRCDTLKEVIGLLKGESL